MAVRTVLVPQRARSLSSTIVLVVLYLTTDTRPKDTSVVCERKAPVTRTRVATRFYTSAGKRRVWTWRGWTRTMSPRASVVGARVTFFHCPEAGVARRSSSKTRSGSAHGGGMPCRHHQQQTPRVGNATCTSSAPRRGLSHMGVACRSTRRNRCASCFYDRYALVAVFGDSLGRHMVGGLRMAMTGDWHLGAFPPSRHASRRLWDHCVCDGQFSEATDCRAFDTPDYAFADSAFHRRAVSWHALASTSRRPIGSKSFHTRSSRSATDATRRPPW